MHDDESISEFLKMDSKEILVMILEELHNIRLLIGGIQMDYDMNSKELSRRGIPVYGTVHVTNAKDSLLGGVEPLVVIGKY